MTSLYAGGADIVSVGPGEAPAVKNLLIMSASFCYCKRCSPQGLREGGWIGRGGGGGGRKIGGDHLKSTYNDHESV